MSCDMHVRLVAEQTLEIETLVGRARTRTASEKQRQRQPELGECEAQRS